MELFEIRQGIDQYSSKLKQLGESLDLETKQAIYIERINEKM